MSSSPDRIGGAAPRDRSSFSAPSSRPRRASRRPCCPWSSSWRWPGCWARSWWARARADVARARRGGAGGARGAGPGLALGARDGPGGQGIGGHLRSPALRGDRAELGRRPSLRHRARPPGRPSPGSSCSARPCRSSSPAAPGWPGRRACGCWRWPRGASPTPPRHGDLGSFTPSETVVLAPAALAVAVCVGLGIAAFENDLSGREFGWRQLVSAAAIVFVAVGLLPVAGGAVGGRWDLPSQGVEQPLAFLAQPSTSVSRVLWLGDPRALPAGGWSVAIGPGLRPHAAGAARHGPGVHPCRPGSGRARSPRPSASPSPAAPCISVACWRPPACATSSWWTRWPRRWSGRAPTSVSAPPPAGLERRPAPAGRPPGGPRRAGRAGLRERGGHAGHRHARRRAAGAGVGLPERDGRGGLAAGAERARRTAPRRPGAVPAGTLYAGYAPAGAFALTVDGHTVTRQSAFGWAAQYAVTRQGPGHPLALAVPLRPAWRSSWSWRPGCCWPWRSIGRPRRARGLAAGRRAPSSAETVILNETVTL